MKIKLNLEDVAEFVTIASGFESDINIHSIHNGVTVDGKSIMSVIGLDLGSELVVEVNSIDEEEVEVFKERMRKYIVNE